jgi:RHS repeat-associated protein
MGKNVVCDYDANLRKIDQAVALGTADESWTLYEYDAVGNLKKTTDPRSKETIFDYDARNRKIWMDSPVASDRASSTGHTMTWEYNGVGNKTKETRADNAFRSWDYDIPNRITHAIDWRLSTSEPAITTTYERNATSTVETTKDAKNAVYTFAFDQLHRKTSETYPVDATSQARTETWHYDGAGNIDQHVNVAGNTNTLEYDNRNRLHRSSWASNGPITVTNYDAASRITDITTNNGETVVAFGYDAANRKIWEDQTLADYPTRRVETPRDSDGKRTSLGVADYFLTSFGYTERNQLKSVNGFANFTYDRSGNMINRASDWVYASGTNYYYDELNRATQIEHGGGQVFFARSHYQYDHVGREVATWRDEQSSKGERFGYNVRDQLTNVNYNADQVWTGNPTNATSNVGYIVDALNRQGVNYDGVFWGFQPNAMNQYFGVAGVGINYDAQFNQTTGLYGATFSYDAENHLVGGSMQATYDGLGRCVRRTVGGVTRLFTYDDWKPFLEWDGAGNWWAWNIYGAGPDEILARYDAIGQASIYKQDQHGNVVAVLNQYGEVSEKYTYDAFGKPKVFDRDGNERTGGSAIGNRFLFTGREWIKELAIYDYRHRYYDPLLGRFLQTDPMGLQTEGEKLSAGQKALFSPGGSAPEAFSSSEMNLFRYCGDDPVDGSDPMGLTGSEIVAKIIRFIQGARNTEKTLQEVRTVKDAARALKEGEDVRFKSEKLLKEAYKEAGVKNPVKETDKFGTHYHDPQRKFGGHAFFGSAGVATIRDALPPDASAFEKAGASVLDFFNPVLIVNDVLEISRSLPAPAVTYGTWEKK